MNTSTIARFSYEMPIYWNKERNSVLKIILQTEAEINYNIHNDSYGFLMLCEKRSSTITYTFLRVKYILRLKIAGPMCDQGDSAMGGGEWPSVLSTRLASEENPIE
jgi:hypothetical protein